MRISVSNWTTTEADVDRSVAAIAPPLASLSSPIALAQWSGRANETVIYGISKAKSDLQISGAAASNAQGRLTEK